jgi:hypothetical protein
MGTLMARRFAGKPVDLSPKGSLNGGKRVTDFWHHGLTELSMAEVKRIMRKGRTHGERVAAAHLLHAYPADPADFEPLVNGTKTLRQLRNAGIDTTQIKKVEPVINEAGEVVGYKVEFFDRSGAALDRILDRTLGKPTTVIEGGDNPLRILSAGVPAEALNLPPELLYQILVAAEQHASQQGQAPPTPAAE